MSLDLTKILQDALEFEKIRDATTPGEWKAVKDLPPLDGFDVEPLGLSDGELGYGLLSQEDATFIAAAKNYDCVSTIKSLVEMVKELEDYIGALQ